MQRFRTAHSRWLLVLALFITSQCTFLLSGSYVSAMLFEKEETTVHASDSQEIREQRLQGRIQKHTGMLLTLEEADALAKHRTELMERAVTVTFTNTPTEAPKIIGKWRFSAGEHPEWIVFVANEEEPRYAIDTQAILRFIEEQRPFILPGSSHAETVGEPQEGWVKRIHVEGEQRDGYDLESQHLADKVKEALENNEETIAIETKNEHGGLLLATGADTVKLALLSTGRSNFAKSPYGRRSNVEKALNERLNGVVVNPGETFSFNDAIRGGVGWRDALIIGKGGKLISEPGGGICQAATTVFRAALLAGLPVLKRANHSLYVGYYEEYGVGADATVYDGKQDLIFKNDTAGPIVIVGKTEGDDAYVDIYGIPDGRTISMEGPYFSSTAPETFTHNGRKLYSNEIAWTHTTRFEDGREETATYVSRYSLFPRTLWQKYPENRGEAELLGTYEPQGAEEIASR